MRQGVIDQTARGAVIREIWADEKQGTWTLVERDGERLCVLERGQRLAGRRLEDFR